MVARRADAETLRSASAGGHDSAPPGINFHDLREAIQTLEVVIGSVDRLRDEILPEICGKLRSIASSSRTAQSAATRAPGTAGPPSSGSSSTQLTYNKMVPQLKLRGASAGSTGELKQGGPGAAGSGGNHADGQAGELRDVVNGQAGDLRDVVRGLHEHLAERIQAMHQQQSRQWDERLQALLGERHADGQASELRDAVRSLHERLEERMQAMYRQHSTQWEERLQALLDEARAEHPPAEHPPAEHPPAELSLAEHALADPSVRSWSARGGCVGRWRDLQGGFCHGAAIVIAEEGWQALGPGRTELEPAAANPVEFLSMTRCKLLLPADEEENLQGAPFDVELSQDDSLIVTPLDDTRGGAASFTLARVGGRRRKRDLAAMSGLGLVSPQRPPTLQNLARRVISHLDLGGSPSSEWREQLRLRLQVPQGSLMGIFLTKRYELVQVVMIVLDAIVLAWRTQHAAESFAGSPDESARSGIKDDVLLVLLNDLFCLWFALDLAGRALAEGRYFFRATVLLPHSFEVFIVVAYILEASAVHAHYDAGSKSRFRFVVGFVSLTRMLRLLRLVHMSELVRCNRAFRELRMMMYAVQGAMKSLAWSLVMLVVVLLIFGIIFTNGYLRHVVTNKADPDGAEVGDLRDSFGTLFLSMFTLMKTVTGGQEWGDVYPSLELLNWPYRMFYVLYQIFATLALLNVITAVFVESTMQCSTRDLKVIDEISARKELLMRISNLFEEFDEDGDGHISMEELRVHMQNTRSAAYFASLGIDVDQVDKLFQLLDQDSSGTIDREEFMRGFSRLRGEAKSIDLAVLQSDVSQVIDDLAELSELVHRSATLRSAVSSRQSGRLSA